MKRQRRNEARNLNGGRNLRSTRESHCRTYLLHLGLNLLGLGVLIWVGQGRLERPTNGLKVRYFTT